MAEMAKQTTLTFHILQNTGYFKETLCCNPPLDPKLVFSCIFRKKTPTLNKKTKLEKKRKKTKDKEKGF